MIVNGKALFEFIDTFFRKEGYIKKKDTWYKKFDECTCFFSVGKSPFGGRYDHVMGCFLNELNETNNDYPAYNKNHLKYHLGKMVDKELLERVFSLDNNEFEEDEREALLKEFMEMHVLPFLKDISCKKGIKKAVKKYEDLIYYLKGDARDALRV